MYENKKCFSSFFLKKKRRSAMCSLTWTDCILRNYLVGESSLVEKVFSVLLQAAPCTLVSSGNVKTLLLQKKYEKISTTCLYKHISIQT